MKRIIQLLIILLIFGNGSGASATTTLGADIPEFLRTCMWGTAIGAGVGALSLAFQDNPGEHKMNIARGASLGLYAGVIYGAIQANREPATPSANNPYGFWAPIVDENQIVGLQWSSDVYRF